MYHSTRLVDPIFIPISTSTGPGSLDPEESYDGSRTLYHSEGG